MSKRRVVITGVGAVTCLGTGAQKTWENILLGKSGIGEITHFDVSAFGTRFGGVVTEFDASQFISHKDLKKMDPFIHYGIAAGQEAIEDANLGDVSAFAERVGVAVGAGIGGLAGIEKGHSAFLKGGPRKISPFFIPSNIINMVAGHLSIRHGFKGPNIAIVTACTTGTHNIGEAARMIAYGDADVMIAGGTEHAATPMSLGGFSAAKALSSRNDDPLTASRPWDRDRDGFVLSDGAGIMVLEEYEFAKRRGARIYAELTGYGASSDAYHMTQPAEGGEGAARCMQNALRDAQLDIDAVDYINAHGTSTPAGDIAETQAVKAVFGKQAYKVAVSSTKSMTGHMLGAAGGVEAVFATLAIRDQVAPPTINLENPDPLCDLDYVPGTARPMKIDVALSNSFGFGGTNATLVIAKI